MRVSNDVLREIEITFFFTPDCESCEEVYEFIEENLERISTEIGVKVTLKPIEVFSHLSIAEELGIVAVPSILIGKRMIIGSKEKSELIDEIKDAIKEVVESE